MQPVMTADQIVDLMEQSFPQARAFGLTIEAVEPGFVRVRRPVGDANLRPGGTVSGPTMMALADTAFYFVVLAHIGPQVLAVTTHLSIDFMRKPAPGALSAEAVLHKLGRHLAVGQVLIRSGTDPRPVAQASVTYSIPPDQGRAVAAGEAR